tara:strand:- start:194 stop:442 length:249 start_codon:yes stop_codon:yes gene_type:complete
MMKKLLLVIILVFFTIGSVFADTWVNGYYRSDGTYVQGHYRSSPNSSKQDNWSTSGNTNPYTGKKGTKTYGGNCTAYSLLKC